MSIPTFGEQLFERYLQSQGIKYEREPELPGISQLVDYAVDHPDCGKILLEGKDIENEPPAPGGLGFFDPYHPIRMHIEAGKKKFKNTADYTCALVLAAPPTSFVMLEDPRTIMGPMYGDLGCPQPRVPTPIPVADSGARRKGFRGDRENDSGVKANGIPG